MAVTFDCFGTLVAVERTDDPAGAVADELAARGVAVPEDWASAYRQRHVDAPEGAEVPLPAHVAAALRSRGVDPSATAVRRAVVAAFDPEVTTREGAPEAVRAAAEAGPVGICSNCSVPGLVGRVLTRSAVDRDLLDAVVTSAGCGWRKPDRRAFDAAAGRLGVPLGDLVHVGDDPRTDGAAAGLRGDGENVQQGPGARAVLLEDVPLPEFSDWLEANGWP